MNFIKTVFWIGIFLGLTYTGFQFATPYYKYYAFKSSVTDIAHFDARTPADIMPLIMAKAKETGVPVTEEDIEIKGENGVFSVKAKWGEEVNLMDQYKKRIDFSLQVP